MFVASILVLSATFWVAIRPRRALLVPFLIAVASLQLVTGVAAAVAASFYAMAGLAGPNLSFAGELAWFLALSLTAAVVVRIPYEVWIRNRGAGPVQEKTVSGSWFERTVVPMSVTRSLRVRKAALLGLSSIFAMMLPGGGVLLIPAIFPASLFAGTHDLSF